MERREVEPGKWTVVMDDEEYMTLVDSLKDYREAKKRSAEMWQTVRRTLLTSVVLGVVGVFGMGVVAWIQSKTGLVKP